MELVNITYNGQGISSQDLSVLDKQLVTSNYINAQFGDVNDYVELYVYDEVGNLLESDYDARNYYPYLTANPKNSTYSSITLDPETDLRNKGYNRGNLNAQYNFYRNLFNSSFGKFYWIKEISTSRTELKLSSQTISSQDIKSGLSVYQAYIATKNYYPIFYLNFGNNQTVIAENVVYYEDDLGGYLLIKLYEALPTQYDIKTQLWIVDKIAESVSFNVSITVETSIAQNLNSLRGPNFNVAINSKNGQTTPYYSYNSLFSSPISSSYQKLMSYYQDKSIELNLDYSDFSNFIHFSSATERVNNFVYKLGLIESYNSQISQQQIVAGSTANSSIASGSINTIQSSINNIIEKFDIYEYFLYFNSSSWAWPKSTSTQPYSLYSVTSSRALSFLGSSTTSPNATTQSLLFSASYYDATNKDLLHSSIPQYLLDDPNNDPYVTFIDMIGQHFDNIWVYYKDLSNRYNATNNPNTGISLDIVSDALRGLGIQLYTNSNVSDNLYYTLFGINDDGSLLPPTGSELITNYVTSSLTTLPSATIQDEIYKRLYHNLPYLLKTKGTQRGVKALISSFGVPSDILGIYEFGGQPANSFDGVFDLDTTQYKVSIDTGSFGNVTGSVALSASVLSPYTTIQHYDKNNRINSTAVEVGFSPANTINNNISSSLGTFDINQLIGNPKDQYSSSYSSLVSSSNAYFLTYTQPNSVWEYIRLIKFYNNSLFKMIKDYVPARANVSTGIIVKSHMLERNKYARHEPSATFQNYSQSIDLLNVSASDGGMISPSSNTNWSGLLVTSLGGVPYSSSQNVEKYTGQFSGSNIVVKHSPVFSQKEISSKPAAGLYVTYSLSPLYQNVTDSVRSIYLWDLDYSTNQLKPINFGIITKSINDSQINNYADYIDPMSPYAMVQDYNYELKRSTIPRYEGSKTISQYYTSWSLGDSSYGKTAAIDKIKYQYAYLIDIYSSSMFLPGRSNAQIKYVIDDNQNVLDLTKANFNIFSVQNIFKSGETTDISLFEYDEKNWYTQQLADNPTLPIFEGGFRYLPVLHNVSGSAPYQNYLLTSPIPQNITVTTGGSGGGGGGTTPQPEDPWLQEENWSVSLWSYENYDGGSNTSGYQLYVSASYIGGGSNPPYPVTIHTSNYLNIFSFSGCTAASPNLIDVSIATGNKGGYSIVADPNGILQPAGFPTMTGYTPTGNGSGWSSFTSTPSHWPPYPPFSVPNCFVSITSIDAGSGGGGGGGDVTTTYTFYTTNITSSQACLYYLTGSNQLVFNNVIANNYVDPGFTFDSTSDPYWAGSSLETVILPFSPTVGDRISLYDSSSRLAWDERFEYVVKSVTTTGSLGTTGSRLLVELDRSANLALFVTQSVTPDATTKSFYRACRYIVWKHVPDETNVMLRYNPKDSSIVENGLLFPQYIDPNVKQNSGNTVKALKQQNLINPDKNTVVFS
jgi:hypothetical protein